MHCNIVCPVISGIKGKCQGLHGWMDERRGGRIDIIWIIWLGNNAYSVDLGVQMDHKDKDWIQLHNLEIYWVILDQSLPLNSIYLKRVVIRKQRKWHTHTHIYTVYTLFCVSRERLYNLINRDCSFILQFVFIGLQYVEWRETENWAETYQIGTEEEIRAYCRDVKLGGNIVV